ncbi:MAG: carbohydrate kinase family protein [Hyphomicrobium sp.]|nr:carbohydrate kinase family protein [Hyphomicrobium sp.]
MKATVIGGAMIDTIAIIDSDRIEKMSMANADSTFLLLEAGRKIDAREVSTHTGGGAVNVAVALARLGNEVTIIAKVGRDERAAMISARLASEGISTDAICSADDQPTGASVLIASHDKDAAIFTYRGANVTLTAADIPSARLASSLVYVAPLSDNAAEAYAFIVETAKSNGAFVAVNPGIRQISARGQKFRDTLSFVDLLILNRKEAEGLVPLLVAEFGDQGKLADGSDVQNPPRLFLSGLSGGGYDFSLVGFLSAITRAGTKAIAITDSSRGSYVATPGNVWHCPAAARTVAGTAGAGDAFGATLACELARGAGVEDALRPATSNAASVVGHVDTQTGLQSRAALAAAVAADRKNLEVRHWTMTL